MPPAALPVNSVGLSPCEQIFGQAFIQFVGHEARCCEAVVSTEQNVLAVRDLLIFVLVRCAREWSRHKLRYAVQ